MIAEGLRLNDARYEIKFSASGSAYDYHTGWLQCHDLAFYRPFPPRTVNNIYFDTLDLESYCENLMGVSSRTKLRLRWYGELAAPSATKLELKVKRNRYGWKHGEAVELKEDAMKRKWSDVCSKIEEQVSDDLRVRFQGSSFPALINRYRRDYFVSADSRVRITLDKDIAFFDQRATSKANLCFRSNSPEIMIMEVKVAYEDADLARRVLNSVNATPSKSSKYVIGIQSIIGK